MKEIYVLGNKITQITAKELNEEIGQLIRAGKKELIFNTNIHGINLANNQLWLKELRNSSYIVFCDGKGVILGGRMLGKRMPEKIPVTEWIWDICSYAAENKFSLFFLGTTKENIEKATEKLTRRYPNLLIKGVHHGFFEKEGPENEYIVDLINIAKPDILIVAMGMSLQEKWLKDNWKKLDAKVFLVGGACFDYVSGNLKRGPKILTHNGLEWFCRLIIEPRRLWRRYLIGSVIFFIQILKEAIFKRHKVM